MHLPPPKCNIQVIKHLTNRRQGGARNTAIRQAQGDYLVFIDQDDTLAADALPRLRQAIAASDRPDFVMCDFVRMRDEAVVCPASYGHNVADTVMTGAEFFRRQEVPWMPWLYCYRRDYVLDHDFRFEENVRFEDVDWIMKITAYARRCVYANFPIINHYESAFQQSAVGNDRGRIIDLFKISTRIRKVAEEVAGFDTEMATRIRWHHYFHHRCYGVKMLWRLRGRDIRMVMRENPLAPGCPWRLTRLIFAHPRAYVCLAAVGRPLLNAVWLAYSRLKAWKHSRHKASS